MITSGLDLSGDVRGVVVDGLNRSMGVGWSVVGCWLGVFELRLMLRYFAVVYRSSRRRINSESTY